MVVQGLRMDFQEDSGGFYFFLSELFFLPDNEIENT